METIKSLNKWANAHTYYPLDLLRVALGVFLFIKGIDFMGNTGMLLKLFEPLQSVAGEMAVIHYIAPAHFVGGILIAFGLLTRWAIVAQLPILIGAVAINFVGEMNQTNLILSGVALILSLFFLVYGSGKHSVDKYLRMQK
ncbi:DoxX family protein [Aureitalea marina]|uniref:DoxX family membrane protein n=1 Tax=Aureitalea marina TaxID=930804 RepID=A0A2S7KN81_9FLAO|nr:DoxX family protein [Aureitalea marina]PQB04087.1 DoxX family membrane protein [Aureitalea marina]